MFVSKKVILNFLFLILYSANFLQCMDNSQKLSKAEDNITAFVRKQKGGILGFLYHTILNGMLAQACEQKNLPRIKKIISLGVNHDVSWNVFTTAVAAGNLEIVQFLQNKFSININKEFNYYHYKPLHIAACEGNLSMVEWLLSTLSKASDKYVALNNSDNYLQSTPLHEAIIHNRRDIAHFLINRIENINKRYFDNLTLLQCINNNRLHCSVYYRENHFDHTRISYRQEVKNKIYFINLLISKNADLNLTEPTTCWSKDDLSSKDGPQLCYRTFLHAIIQRYDYSKEQCRQLVALSLMCKAKRQQDSDDKYPEEYTTDSELKKMIKTREGIGKFFNTKHPKNRKMLFEVKFKRDLNLSIAPENLDEQENKKEKKFDMSQFLHYRELGIKNRHRKQLTSQKVQQ